MYIDTARTRIHVERQDNSASNDAPTSSGPANGHRISIVNVEIEHGGRDASLPRPEHRPARDQALLLQGIPRRRQLLEDRRPHHHSSTPTLIPGPPDALSGPDRGAIEPANGRTPVRAKSSILESMWPRDWPLHQDE